MSEAITTANGGDNSFISNIKEGFSSGLKSIGQDILPVWAKSKLAQESSDQLANPTYNSNAPGAATRIDQLATSVTGGASGKSLLIIGVLAAVVIGGAFFVTRK